MKPILFNTDMVRAILAGHKTVTRRMVKPKPTERPALKMCQDDVWRLEWWNVNEFHSIKVPICIGDILYVRETFCAFPVIEDGIYLFGHRKYCYKTDLDAPSGTKWHPSIHMPREAARIFLRVTDVRVERLREIDDEGAKAEGSNWRNGKHVGFEEKMQHSSVDRFAEIWDSTIKPADRALYGWEANPWVWVIAFERCGKPEGD